MKVFVSDAIDILFDGVVANERDGIAQRLIGINLRCFRRRENLAAIIAIIGFPYERHAAQLRDYTCRSETSGAVAPTDAIVRNAIILERVAQCVFFSPRHFHFVTLDFEPVDVCHVSPIFDDEVQNHVNDFIYKPQDTDHVSEFRD